MEIKVKLKDLTTGKVFYKYFETEYEKDKSMEEILEELNSLVGLKKVKKVIEDLKKKGCKNIFEKTYRNLFKDFLHSEEYKKYYEDLLKNKGELEAEKFKYCAKKFI